jgi:hypothetical protein
LETVSEVVLEVEMETIERCIGKSKEKCTGNCIDNGRRT